MTHRQRVGLLVIGAAVVMVAVLTGLRPHLVAGAPQAAPVPGAPVVGDCVLDPVAGPPNQGVAAAATSGSIVVPVYPAQRIRPCTGARYGEITAVLTAPKPAVVRGDAGNRYLDDPNVTNCFSAGMQYIGTTTQPIQRFWKTGLQINFALSRQSQLQAAAGQRWAACIVTLQLPQPAQATATAPATTAPRYAGSIRDALHTGQQRDQLSLCLSTADFNGGDRPISCSQPHVLEILGFGNSGGHPVTRVEVEATCQQLVRQITGIPDPTAAGSLSVKVNTQDGYGATTNTPQVPATSTLSCAVITTGPRKLRGSLLALGQQPIPWA